MSVSGSISRRRVGSVSQRGLEAGLPPLDIQSIQMPSNPQNALAMKTAALGTNRSLFQTCSMLKRRLRHVEDFGPFLEQPREAETLDVVSHMCHLLRLGSPLCHLYNLLIPAFTDPESPLYADLPSPPRVAYDFPAFFDSPDGVRNWAKRPENTKACQRYIAQFTMAMNRRKDEGRWHGELWALHELWGKSKGEDIEAYDSTGFMKVLHTVETMLDNLPESALSPDSPQTPYSASVGHRQSYDVPFSMGGLASGAAAVANMAATMNGGVHIEAESAEEMQRSKSSADANAFKSVEELVASEKSYVQELEILVRCSMEMVDAQIVSTETNHQMFSNLTKILDFHRKFLIKLETEYEPIQEGQGPKAWAEGRWGRPFVTSEPEFDCYGPYCANYLDAITIVNEQMPNLLRGQDLPPSERPCLHPERELQAFMIKPIQRITKYGLLLDAILHATAKHDYPFRAELEEGSAAVRRIAASINEVTDFKAKQATVRELVDRVEDWKGHEVEKFGDLWLDDHFTVTKADQPREYHVFLFEKMMLCCKEVVPERKAKSAKNSLRKDKSLSKVLPEKRKLALKGRIFVSNINRATIHPSDPTDPYVHRLTIAWTVPHRGPDGYARDEEDSFIMTGKSEDQIKKWADKVMDLSTTERKKQEEYRLERARLQGRYSNPGSSYQQQSAWAPPTPATEQPPMSFPPPMPNSATSYAWVAEDDEDDSGYRSGRTTPSISGSTVHSYAPSGRRVLSQQSIPADRQADQRARALTEDQFGPSMTQWRSQQMPPPLPRLTSAMSAVSTTSDASFGTLRPSIGRNMSSTRLDTSEEVDEDSADDQRESYHRYAPARGMTRVPSQGAPSSVPYPPALRHRSASSPNVYQQPKVTQAPPIPTSAGYADPYPPNLATSSTSTLVGGTAYFAKRMSAGKRSSGESNSTQTSETSSGQSPATPYSHPGEMRGIGSVSRQNSSDQVAANGNSMIVKVHWSEHVFSVVLANNADYAQLYEKVAKKIRMIRGNSGPDLVHIKWVDADNDEVSLRCDADIEAMFDEARELGATYVNLVAR